MTALGSRVARPFLLVALLLAAATPSAHAGPMISTGAPLTTLGYSFSLAFSPDGRYLANSTSGPATLGVYSVLPGMTLKAAGVPILGDGPHAMTFDPTGRYLAVANDTTKSISLYTMSGTGRLTQANFPAPARDGAGKLSFSRDGKLLAATLPTEHAILVFAVSSAGALIQVGGPIDVGATGRMDIAFSPADDLLAVLDANGLQTFAVSPVGAVTSVGSPITTGGGTTAIAFTPDGRFLTTSDSGPQTLTTYSVSPSGALAQAGARVTDSRQPVSLAYSSQGRLLAALNYRNNTLTTWRLSESGDLTQIDTVATPPNADDDVIAFSPDGALIAVSLRGASKIALYAVSPRGRMTPVGAPAATGKYPGNVIVSPDGGQVVVGGDSLSLFSFADGVLTPTTTPIDLTNGGTDTNVALRADGRLAAFAETLRGKVSTYTVGTDGTLTPAGSAMMPPWASQYNSGANDWPFSVAFDHGGHRLAVALGFMHQVILYDVSDSGQLSLSSTAAFLGDDRIADDMAYSPNGSLLGVTAAGAFSMFSVGAGGDLSPIGPALDTGAGTYRLAFSPDGRLLALTGLRGNAPLLYAISPSGQLSPVGGRPPTGPYMYASAFSPDSRLLALVDRSDATLRIYRVTPDGLEAVGSPTPTGTAGVADGVAWDPTGRYVLVANAGDATVSVFPLAATVLEPSIASRPAAASTDSEASFDLDASYLATYLCALDGRAATACDSPISYTNLSEGHHTFELRARDLLGTVSSTSATWTWTIDRTPPAPIGLTTPAADATALPAATTLAWTPTSDGLTGVQRYVLRIDDQAPRTVDPSACHSTCSVALDELADGPHHWTVEAYDEAGNVRRSDTRAFTVDAAPPGAFAQRAPADGALLASTRPELRWDAAVDAGTGTRAYDVVLDGTTLATVDGSATRLVPAGDLGQGTHQWKVVARDAYGHERVSETRSFTVDTTPPTAVLHVSPSRFVVPYQVTLDASGSTDPGGQIAAYEFDLDGNGTYETSSSGPRVQTTLTTLGDHALGVRVVDRVALSATATDHVTGESTGGPGPRGAFVTIDDGADFTRSLKVTLTINPPPRSGAVAMVVSNDGMPDDSTHQLIAKTVDWTLAHGDGIRDRRTVYVTFYGASGAQVTNGRVTDDILYDPRPPTITAAALSLSSAHRATLTLKAKDTGSGLAGFRLRVGNRSVGHGTRVKRRTTLRLTGTVGDHVTLLVGDKAGNIAHRTLKVRRR